MRTTSRGAPDVSVLMVTYNSSLVVRHSLAPLAKEPNLEVVVVDNASRDHTSDHVRATCPSARLIQRSTNVGFAAAVNEGSRLCTGRYILLLNPDAIIQPEELRDCVESMDGDDSVAVLAPWLRDPSGARKVSEAGRAPTVLRVFNHYSGLSRLARRWRFLEGLYLLDEHLPQNRKVDWVSGACMLIRRQAWEQLGGMTSRWFMYAEDIEFCRRAASEGWKVFLYCDASATHVMGGSSERQDGATETSLSSAWLLNLFELYRQDYAHSTMTAWLWRSIAWAGMSSRRAAFHMLSVIGPTKGRALCAQRSQQFAIHAKRIASAPLALIHEREKRTFSA